MPDTKVLLSNVDNNRNVELQLEEPSVCPLCHHAIRPDIKEGYLVWERGAEEYKAYVPCLCTNCRHMFFVRYIGTQSGDSFHPPYNKMSFPVNFEGTEFSESIAKHSPTFVKTYNQSLAAETQDLNEICGIGYRKALEFLVKDYLIAHNPDQAETIKKEALGNALHRIDDRRIKTLAERTTWIGNDETHYIRKHENLDYTDMKRFIEAMVRYIDSELAFEEALSIPYVK